MFISQTLIVRDADMNILDTIEIDPEIAVTRRDVRVILGVHKGAVAIDRVTTREVRPS